MAYVKILWNRNVVALERYVFEGREMDDPVELNGCTEGLVSEQFIGTQVHHGDRDGIGAIHVIQSFNQMDSTKLSPEEFSQLGRRLVERQFPGHQFCVVTHAESDHVHNHIMVNPVAFEDGKRIHNKTRLLYDLRDKSDQLCRSQGLSIIGEQSQERWRNTPEKVQEIKRRGGFSWVLDLKEKADFAKSVATSFDEYAGVLNQFGIQVRVENQNVVYHYPDRKQKRGDSRGLGAKYCKDGLIEKFKENYEIFYAAGLKQKPIKDVNFDDHWKFHRGQGDYFVPGYRYADLVIPPSLLKTVQGIDLKRQAEEFGIGIVTKNDGKKYLRAREHIRIEGAKWVNEKTGAQGGTLEFVNNLKQESWLSSLERFDVTGRVARVREISENVRPTFRAFYLPNENRKNSKRLKGDRDGAQIFKLSALKDLISSDQISFLPSGRIKLKARNRPKASITLHGNGLKWICRNKEGIGGAFYQKIWGPKDRLLIFENPIQFLGSGRFLDKLSKNQIPMDVYVPLKPLNRFLKDKRQFLGGYNQVSVVRSQGDFGWGRESDRGIEEDFRETAGDTFSLSYESVDDLLRELILGRQAARGGKGYGR